MEDTKLVGHQPTKYHAGCLTLLIVFLSCITCDASLATTEYHRFDLYGFLPPQGTGGTFHNATLPLISEVLNGQTSGLMTLPSHTFAGPIDFLPGWDFEITVDPFTVDLGTPTFGMPEPILTGFATVTGPTSSVTMPFIQDDMRRLSQVELPTLGTSRLYRDVERTIFDSVIDGERIVMRHHESGQNVKSIPEPSAWWLLSVVAGLMLLKQRFWKRGKMLLSR